jgi:hypothetical protein
VGGNGDYCRTQGLGHLGVSHSETEIDDLVAVTPADDQDAVSFQYTPSDSAIVTGPHHI